MVNSIPNKFSISDNDKKLLKDFANAFVHDPDSINVFKLESKNPKLYTVKEVLSILRISKPTLYNLFKSNELKPSKIGRRSFIHYKELERYLEQLNS